MSDFYDEMQRREAELPSADEGYYGPGGETTAEERFLFCEEMVEFLDKWEREFGKYAQGTKRSLLENFAWALKQKIEEEDL